MTKQNRELTEKQRLFVEHYLAGMNGTEAAIAAGYSPTSAHDMASRTLKVPRVQELIKATRMRALKKAGITTEYVIWKLVEIVETGKDAHKVQALKLLGAYLGMFRKDREPDQPYEKENGAIDPHTRAILERARRDKGNGSDPH